MICDRNVRSRSRQEHIENSWMKYLHKEVRQKLTNKSRTYYIISMKIEKKGCYAQYHETRNCLVDK